MHIKVFTIGDPAEPGVNSGTPHQLYYALKGQQSDISSVDVSLNSRQRTVNLIRSFHPSLRIWKEKTRKNSLAFQLMSGNAIARSAGYPPADYRLQFQTLFILPAAKTPSGIYTDYTSALADSEFPDWMPFSNPAAKLRWFADEKQNYQQARHVFTFSERVRQSVIRDFDIEPEKVIVAGAGCRFNPVQRFFQPGKQVKNFLFIGKEKYRKGLDILLRAFEILRITYPDIRLTVIGTKMPHSVNHVYNIPYLSSPGELQKEMENTDVFVMPSRGEPFGYVYLEAMAHGLPCIGADVGGVPEVIRHGETGYLIERENPEQLVYFMSKLIDEPDLGFRMGQAGQQLVRNQFQWSRTADIILTAIQQQG